MAPFIGLLSILIMVSFLLVSICGIGFNTTLIHYNSPDSPFYSPAVTLEEQWKSASQSDQHRYRHMSATPNLDGDHDLQLPVILSYSLYLMEVFVGTPPVAAYAMMDTGSSLNWITCKPFRNSKFGIIPKLLGYESSSYRALRCQSDWDTCRLFDNRFSQCTTDGYCKYDQPYGDRSNITGIISTERFIFPGWGTDHVVNDVIFGCGDLHITDGVQTEGVIGLGTRGVSFVNQLGWKKFSYCLTTNITYRGHISFGDMAVLDGPPTPMQVSDKNEHYHLNLIDISVDGKRLNIPKGTFDMKEDGTGGVILDSGTTMTWLHPVGFARLVRAVIESNILVYHYVKDNSICFEGDESDITYMPTITFHFINLDVVLKPQLTFVTGRIDDMICFVIRDAQRDLTIFGSLTQRDHIVGYNLLTSEVHIAPHPCHIDF